MDQLIVMSVLFCAMFLLVGVAFVDGHFASVEEKFFDVSIISLKDTALIHGRFSLGSGIIDERPSFIYYQAYNNGYQMKSVIASKTTIIEDENEKPFIRQYFIWECGYVTHNCYANYYNPKYELHVPKDTIIRQFNLDSEV